jgi:hypothetical protein
MWNRSYHSKFACCFLEAITLVNLANDLAFALHRPDSVDDVSHDGVRPWHVLVGLDEFGILALYRGYGSAGKQTILNSESVRRLGLLEELAYHAARYARTTTQSELEFH